MKFRCVVRVMDNILHDQTYTALSEICKDLTLSYQQVADISSKRRNKFDSNKFKFAPQISIIKI